MMRALVISILTIVCSSLWLPPRARAQSNEAALFSLLNEFRARIGVQQLTPNESLRIAAAEQARWMAQTGQIAHSHNGSTNRTRALAAGYGSNWVAEIIYISPNTNHITAWNWWLQSPIHYETIIGSYYEHAGIARHTENNRTAYVVVFGNLSGTVPPAASGPAASSGSNATSNDAAPLAPIGLVGQDEHGYILHRIQPGETLGDLALLYGYRTWDVVLTMEALNEINRYSLVVGEVIRIPPYDGTWTPTPITNDTPTPPPQPSANTEIASAPPVAFRATITPAASSSPRPTVIVAQPRVLEIGTATPPPAVSQARSESENERRSIIIALIIALGIQGALLLGIGAVYLRMRGRK